MCVPREVEDAASILLVWPFCLLSYDILSRIRHIVSRQRAHSNHPRTPFNLGNSFQHCRVQSFLTFGMSKNANSCRARDNFDDGHKNLRPKQNKTKKKSTIQKSSASLLSSLYLCAAASVETRDMNVIGTRQTISTNENISMNEDGTWIWWKNDQRKKEKKKKNTLITADAIYGPND